ncbi:MAG: DUF4275 family protein [Bacillus sp. (in: firmicutes)]
MDLLATRSKKKGKVTEIPKWGTYLRKQWEDHFFDHLSENEKKAIYLHNEGGFLWHVFSYEKKLCLKERQADIAFNREPKKSCFVFYQRGADAIIIENAEALTADDFINEKDIYIVDKEFKWTYVRTHESLCGPYFSRRNNEIES